MAQFEVMSRDGKVVGPVSEELLRRGLESGKVPADAQARLVGTVHWEPATTVSERHPPPVESPVARVFAPGQGPWGAHNKEIPRLLAAGPLILAASFSLVYSAIQSPNVELMKAQAMVSASQSLIGAEQTKADSDLTLWKIKASTAAETKQAAISEFDKCVSTAQSAYEKRWEDACTRATLGPSCTLEREGPALNNSLKLQKEECKQHFDMRMLP